jgi:hypothetical protein
VTQGSATPIFVLRHSLLLPEGTNEMTLQQSDFLLRHAVE